MKILIGNKNYSSWSLRPWLVLSHFAIPHFEQLMQLTGEGWKEKIEDLSPTGRVPVLFDNGIVIPETLAIIEYLADTHPHKPIWPTGTAERAVARSIAAETHAGFSGLRTHAPMNLRASYPGRVDFDLVSADVQRFNAIVTPLLEKSGGPYLFGPFSAADAMLAPLATRLKTYAIPCPPSLQAYVEAIHDLPAFQVWYADALKDKTIVEEDEIDFIQGKTA